jgi:hypothetical protein
VTGEHFSSATGTKLDKKKDAYIRFSWETRKKEKHPKQTVLEKEKVAENKELVDFLERHRCRNEESCVMCQKPEAWPLLRVEFYNWVEPNTEKEVFIHDECLKKIAIGSVLEGLRLLGKNPTFLLELNCLSISKCAFFSEGNDFRNCQHIALRFDETEVFNEDGTLDVGMAPQLYCKRSHPGTFFLESESEMYWNIEKAGLAVMAKRLTDTLNTAQIQAQIELAKKENPMLVQEIKRQISQNTDLLGLFSPGAMFILSKIVEPTPEERWAKIQEGNDYY